MHDRRTEAPGPRGGRDTGRLRRGAGLRPAGWPACGLVVVAALTVTLPACRWERSAIADGAEDSAAAGSGGPSGGPAASADAEASRGAGPAIPQPARDSTGAIPILARLSEYEIRLSLPEVDAGRVAISFRNEGGRVHTIEIRGDNGMRWLTLPIRPGITVTLSMSLEAGRYAVRSTEAAYVDRGMTAFLYVR